MFLSFMCDACEFELEKMEGDIVRIIGCLLYGDAWKHNTCGVNIDCIVERLDKIKRSLPTIIQRADIKYAYLLWQKKKRRLEGLK